MLGDCSIYFKNNSFNNFAESFKSLNVYFMYYIKITKTVFKLVIKPCNTTKFQTIASICMF